MWFKLTVAKDGSGDYTDIASAINAVEFGKAALIYIKNGIYTEKLVIDKPGIILVGEDREKTVLRYNDGAFDLGDDGEPIGTFNTASVRVTPEAEGFEAYNLTIENGAGLGSVAGQAVALYLDCDKAIIENCRLLAKQDTLLTAPIFSDIDKDPYICRRQLFKNCYIEGDVDFIFGGAVAVFEDCEICALGRPKALPCYVTAACTSKELKYGYVFRNCHIGGSAGDGAVYLGRPWREYAKVVFIDCKLDKCVSHEGFCTWNDTKRHLTSTYAQYGSYGEGYNEKSLVEWSKVLTAQEASDYATEKVFGDWNYSEQIKKYEDLI